MPAGNRNRCPNGQSEILIEEDHSLELDEALFTAARQDYCISQSEWSPTWARAYRIRQHCGRGSISSSTATGNFSGTDYGQARRQAAHSYGNRQRSTGTGGNFANYGSAAHYASDYPATAASN